MRIHSGFAALPTECLQRPSESIRCFIRQPILDVRGRVHAYELVYRGGPQAYFRGDGELATRTTLDSTLMFGLERLTRGLPVFLKCTPDSLTELLIEVLLPSTTTLELQASWFRDGSFVDMCRKLKREGFRLALDDFNCEAGFEPLTAIADFVMVDLASLGEEGRKYLRHSLRSTAATMIAKNVHTREGYQEALEEGFSLFQGFYFCQPEVLKGATIPANFASRVLLLQYLRRDTVDFSKLAEMVMLDAALTYRLLRLVNSALAGMRQQIRCLESALMIVGEQAFRRMATLAIASELGSGATEELAQMALVRGRFCDRAARHCGLQGEEQYLLGMLSVAPAMLRVPMEDLLRGLPLRDSVGDALKGIHNADRTCLDWLECYERGDWAACDEMAISRSLNSEALNDCFLEALHWAESAVQGGAGS